ncbi:hypothetical protein K474DRAFT_1660637 [Panus rudis PR-1116 ss-1]|nr:hypothetical protein K474DRAFT_1660637 [Panus rudis PR-1116 ss-1]
MSTPTVVDPRTKSQADFPDPDEPGISKSEKIRRKKVINAWEAEKDLIKAEEEEQRDREEAERRERERLAKEEADRRAREEQKKREEEEARRKAEEEARKKAEEEARKRAEEVARKKAEEKAREDARRAKEAEKGKGRATAPLKALEAGPSGSWVPGLKTPCYNCHKKDYDCIRGKTETGKPSKSCANCLESKIQCSRDPTSGPSRKAPRKPIDPDYIDVDEEEDDEEEVPKKKKTTSKAASEGTRRAVGGDLGPQIERMMDVLERQVAASERQANALERILAGQAEQTKYLNYLAVYTKNIGNTLHEVGGATLAHARGYLTKEGFRDFDIGEGLPGTLNRGPTGGGKRMRVDDSEQSEEPSKKRKRKSCAEKRKEQEQDEGEKDGEGEPDVGDAGDSPSE